MKNAVAYYRVSTEEQGESKLGLLAQEHAVREFAEREGYTIVSDYTEVMSGRKNDRPQLRAALAQCKKQRATLLISKLDRLSRRVSLVANLTDSKVDFRLVDHPSADKTVIQMLAVFAEHELDQIGKRTKEGLAAAKRDGRVLGRHVKEVLGPQGAIAAVAFAEKMRPVMDGLEADGFRSIRSKRDELNRRKIPTYRGNGAWHYCSVHAIMKRLKAQATNQQA